MSWVVSLSKCTADTMGGKLGAQETLSGNMCGWQWCAPSLRLTAMCTILFFVLWCAGDKDTKPLMSSRFWGGDGKQSDMRNLWVLFRTMNKLSIDHIPVLRMYKELLLNPQ